MTKSDLSARVAALRGFNRFYTRHIGVLNEGLLSSHFSLTEARVMYELAHERGPTATALCAELGLDAGYLSRILRGFERRGLVEKQVSEADGRQSHLWLTEAGQAAYAELDAAARQDIETVLSRLTDEQQQTVVGAMQTIERLLGAPSDAKVSYILRPPNPGDLGWIVHRHGVLYAQEYGFDEHFEALVAGIVANFIEHFDPKWERAWIAEKDGENVGSISLVKQSDTVAKLRLLAGRATGARAWDRCAIGGRVRAIRPASRLFEDHSVDGRWTGCGPAHLCEGRFSPGQRRTGAKFRPSMDLGDVGTGPVGRAYSVSSAWSSSTLAERTWS